MVTSAANAQSRDAAQTRPKVFEVRRTAHGLVCSSSGARRGGLWRDSQTDLVWWGNLFAEGTEVLPAAFCWRRTRPVAILAQDCPKP